MSLTSLPAVLPRCEPGVGLWLGTLDRNPGEVSELARVLSSAEHNRAARFGTDLLRRRWIVGRATLRALLGAHLEIEPAAVPLRRGVRGRPEIDMAGAPDFNVSNTAEVVLIAMGVGLQPGERVGVDLERADRVVNADALARKFMTERERSGLASLDADARRRGFLRLWTCKEAMSKATGDALSAPFRNIDVDAGHALRLRAGPPPYTPERWRLIAAEVDEALIATVAVWKGT